VKKLGERLRADSPQALRDSLVRKHTQLLRHGEACLSETPLGRSNLQMQRTGEVCACHRNHEGQPERRLVELIDGHHYERARLRLLRAPCRVRVSPDNIALTRTPAQ
jgi:Fe2+ transport system protein FeoA